MRRAARVDANQAEIVETLRAYGASVFSLAAVGCGCPDLVVGIGGHTHLVEVKNRSRWPSDGKLRQGQVEWHATWRGAAVTVLASAEQAAQWVQQRGRGREER